MYKKRSKKATLYINLFTKYLIDSIDSKIKMHSNYHNFKIRWPIINNPVDRIPIGIKNRIYSKYENERI